VTAVELTRLGQEVEQESVSLAGHAAGLDRTPATKRDVILGCDHGIAFERFDTLLKRVEAACRKHGAHRFDGQSGAHTLDGARDLLASTLAGVAAYREVERP